MDFFKRSDYQRVLLYIAASAAVILALKYLLPYFLPLIVALLIVLPLQRALRRREEKARGQGKPGRRPGGGGRSFMAGGILFGLILLAALVLVGLGTFLVIKARGIVQEADVWTENISRVLSELSTAVEDFFGMERGTAETWITEKISAFGGRFADSGSGLFSGGAKYLSAAGHIGTFLVVSFICVVLFAREVDGWQQGLLTLATIEPAIDRILSIILRIGKKLGAMIKTYFKTQIVIFLCISAAATTGLYLGGMDEAWFYGIFAGFMDFLPFIGTGIVLIPIGVVSFIQGRIGGGIVILITYLVCVLIREVLEPRLMGNDLKFSPVSVLLSVYAGMMYYGVSGVILGPITLLILVELGKEIFRING